MADIDVEENADRHIVPNVFSITWVVEISVLTPCSHVGRGRRRSSSSSIASLDDRAAERFASDGQQEEYKRSGREHCSGKVVSEYTA